MTEMYPAYYEAFRCTAGTCRHNCCIGWEIDIDGKSAARYAALPGAFGERVRAAVEPGEPPHFRLDAAGRCAMLREDTLCELQRTLGESALCNICRDHPRYRVFLPGRTEIGLGLCCEEAARLLLSQTEKLRSDDPETTAARIVREAARHGAIDDATAGVIKVSRAG